MGVTGVEGVYRKSCEVAFRVQQANKDTLLGILETFVHDPLVEWSRCANTASSRSGAPPEKMDPKQILRRVGRRFEGHPDVYNESGGSHALNVEGVVQKLISSATSPELLSLMYFWWMPWI